MRITIGDFVCWVSHPASPYAATATDLAVSIDVQAPTALANTFVEYCACPILRDSVQMDQIVARDSEFAKLSAFQFEM